MHVFFILTDEYIVFTRIVEKLTNFKKEIRFADC